MARGCIRTFFTTLGCLTFVLIAALAVWTFRDELGNAYRSVTGREPPGPLVPDSVIGLPSTDALRSAERKERQLASGDAGYVRLTADEVAALVHDRLDPDAREALDSVRVILYPDLVVLDGRVRLNVFGRELLGPLGGVFGSSEPLRVAGPLEVSGPGLLGWRVTQFAILRFPFPGSAIPALVNRLTGRTDGAFPIAVPEPVSEVRVRPDGVTLYRRVE
jgi:hypothetical protein